MVVGLASEARLAEAPNVIVGAGRAGQLAERIEAAIDRGARRLLSFGVAGGLRPDLEAGAVVIAAAIVDGGRRWPCDAAWSAAMIARLGGRTVSGDIAGVATPVVDPAAKATLFAASGALAADMESLVVAEIASRRGLPFAACRIVVDPAPRALPPAALVPPREDGEIDLAATLRALARRPGQLPALIRLAADWRAARAALADARARLGAGFAGVDLGEL